MTFGWFVCGVVGQMPPVAGLTATDVIILIQAVTAIVGCGIGYRAMYVSRNRRRPGDQVQPGVRYAAGLIMAAVAMIAVGSLLHTVWATLVPPFASAILLLPALPLVPAAFALPRSGLKDSQRFRVLVDGLMILAGTATFSWFFLAGPVLERHWSSNIDEASTLLYPAMDVALVGALLIISAKASRLPERRWWPMVAGIALLILSDPLRELAQSGRGSNFLLPVALRCIASLFLIVAGVRFVYFSNKGQEISQSGEPASTESEDPDRQVSDESAHIWDSLLPYALVPLSAALAAYAWNKGYPSEITGGVFVGTSILVALTFVRQLLAFRETRRLYERVTEAFEESVKDSVHMEVLNEELQRTKEQLQSNNAALARANLSLQAQATTDPLTELPNHRSMAVALDQELDRANRYSRPCSLLFLDLDHFKALNDSCGHLIGDSVLREMVNPIMAGLRATDVAGRWGGEEFVVILPETEIGDAVLAAERIRNLVSRHGFTGAGGAHITCSVGAASFPYDAGSRDELVEAADRAMYAAKRLGRNQVRTAVDPSVIAFHSEIRHGSSREETSLWGIVEALTSIVKAHDQREDLQSMQVSKISMRVATTLALSGAEVRMVGLAARLHDVGMVSVPQDVLSKPAALNSEDWSSVMAHPDVGAQVVGNVPALSMLSPLIRSHHEWWDGSGYPDGLVGEDIPIGGRIISVCAAYIAMTLGSKRSGPRSPDAALKELHECAGTQFDPAVVAALHQVVLTQVDRSISQAS